MVGNRAIHIATTLVLVIAGVSVFQLQRGDKHEDGPRSPSAEKGLVRPALDDPSVSEGGRELPIVKRGSERYVRNRLIVSFKEGTPESVKTEARRQAGVELVRALPLPGSEVVSVTPGFDLSTVRRSLQRHPATSYAEPDHVYTVGEVSADDPRLPDLWGLHDLDSGIEAPLAWTLGTGSNSVTVGVVDSGVAYDHPDLANNIWTNPGESGGGRESNGLDDDRNGYVDDFRGWDWIGRTNNPQDQNGHGTHVAGTIGAHGNNSVGVAGVNWDVDLVPLRVLDAQGSGVTSSIAAAFTYAGELGIDIVNASLGGPSLSKTVQDAVLRYPETLFVVSAGNNAEDNDTVGSYPCNLEARNLICVASITRDAGLSSFSNTGATTVDLGAPGGGILSTLPPSLSTSGYGIYSGTSMATPHVAGAAALVKAAAPDMSVDGLRKVLLEGTSPFPALEGRTVTGGRLNLAGALRAAGRTLPGLAKAEVPSEPLAPTPTIADVPAPTPSGELIETHSPPPAPAPSIHTPEPDPSPSLEPSPVPSGTTIAPQPSPSASAIAPPAEVETVRAVTITLVKSLVVKAVVAPGSSGESCGPGTPVVIKRNGRGVARGLFNDVGRFKVRLKDRSGRYTAIAIAAGNCARAVAHADHRVSASGVSADATTCWNVRVAEQSLLELTDAARRGESVRRLVHDPALSRLARSHSKDMAATGRLSHTSSSVLSKAVSGWTSLGENVGTGSDPASLHRSFMGSEAHRANILKPGYTHIGIGTKKVDGRLWVTVIFKTATDPKVVVKPTC